MKLDMEQGTNEWLELRKQKITGTDAGIILGVNPWKNAYKLWAQKLGKMEPDFANANMLKGQELEPEARFKYEKLSDIKMIPSVHIGDINPWQMCSTDGINRDESIILEIKSGKKALEQCKADIIPDYYMSQMQHNMMVTGAKECHYFCYYPSLGYSLKVVPRDEEYITDMNKKEVEFFNLLKNEVAPETEIEEHIVIDSKEFLDEAALYLEADKAVKEAEKTRKLRKAKLIELTDDSNVKGGGIKLTRVSKESIDYKTAAIDSGIDLSTYKKEGIGFYMITKYKEA